jgi:hypothetical protein
MNKLRDSLVQSILCTAVFATVFAVIVSCGGGNPLQSFTGSNRIVRLVNNTSPINVAVPGKLNGAEPLMAGLLQTQPQTSALQQSFNGQGPCLTVPMPTSGYIPIWLYMENGIGGPFGKGSLVCGGVFAQIGGGVDLISGKTLTNPGVAMFLDGTLTTLVATGVTVNGNQVRCNDVSTTVAVHDGDLVQPYFSIASNSVILGIGTNQLPFTCSLSVPQGDQVSALVVQFAKI